MTNESPTLVYIASMSRSGSTLLDLLLDQHPAIASVGELHVLPHELLHANGSLPCGCNEAVGECPVWASVAASAQPLTQPSPRLHHFRETHQWGPTIRPRELMRRRSGRPPELDSSRQYLHNTNEVLQAFATAMGEVTGSTPSLIVDASKDPYRLEWLVAPPESTVRVIHLTRDPRAVVNSLTRDVSGLERFVTTVRRASAWALENWMIRRSLVDLPAGRALRVRYEDLATDPAGTLAAIHEWLAVEPHPPEDVRPQRSHALAGNPMRRIALQEIRLDRRWHTELPKPLALLVSAITRPGQQRKSDV